MADLHIIVASYFELLFPGRPGVPDINAGTFLRLLAEPDTREALLAWLAAEGIVSEAGVWDPPDVTGELIKAKYEVEHGAGQAIDTTDMSAEGCEEKIDRGMAYMCGDNPHGGGEDSCGLFFCYGHLYFTTGFQGQRCEACDDAIENGDEEEHADDPACAVTGEDTP